MDPDEPDRHEQLRQEIMILKERLKKQEDLLQGREPWEGQEYYTQIEELEKKRLEKQKQYNELMKKHFRFVNRNSELQKVGDKFLEDKLGNSIQALTRQIQGTLDSRSSRSSLSSNSLFDKVQSMDWLLHDRSQKYLKEQQKIMVEIGELQKLLQNIK